MSPTGSDAEGGCDALLTRSALAPEQRQWLARAVALAADIGSDPLARMGAAGLLTGQAGLPADLAAYALGWIDLGHAQRFAAQSLQAMRPILLYGSPAQRERFLGHLSSGAWTGCGSLETGQALGVPGGYRLHGELAAAVNADAAEVFVIWAHTEDGALQAFALERGMQQLTTPSAPGLAAAPAGRIVMGGVFVPREAALPGALGTAARDSLAAELLQTGLWGLLGTTAACLSAVPPQSKALIRKELEAVREIVDQALAAARAPVDPAVTARQVQACRRLAAAVAGHPAVQASAARRHLLNLEVVNTVSATHDGRGSAPQ